MSRTRPASTTVGDSEPSDSEVTDEPTLYLVRHASAGRRDDSDPDDGSRPLDDKGRDQAQRVAELLMQKPIRIVASSPLRRCMQTLEPLANALGVSTSAESALAEMSDIDDAWAALEAAIESVGTGYGAAAVLCSHGDMIPDLIRRATRRGTMILGRSGWAKGSIWELRGWDGTTFRTARYVAQEDFSIE